MRDVEAGDMRSACRIVEPMRVECKSSLPLAAVAVTTTAVIDGTAYLIPLRIHSPHSTHFPPPSHSHSRSLPHTRSILHALRISPASTSLIRSTAALSLDRLDPYLNSAAIVPERRSFFCTFAPPYLTLLFNSSTTSAPSPHACEPVYRLTSPIVENPEVFENLESINLINNALRPPARHLRMAALHRPRSWACPGAARTGYQTARKGRRNARAAAAIEPKCAEHNNNTKTLSINISNNYRGIPFKFRAWEQRR